MRQVTQKVWHFRKQFLPTPLCIILLLTIILRIPNLFEPYWYGDEAIYLAVGTGLRQGLLLYRDIFDHKPPIIYLLAAIAGSIIWFKLILILWHLATIVVFWKLAQKLFSNSSIHDKDKDKAVLVSTLLFSVFTTLPTLEGNLVNAEILLAGPILLGFYYLWSEKLSPLKLFLTGLIFSVGFLLKVPAAFDIISIFAFWGLTSLWNIKKMTNTIYQSFLVVLGIIIPVLLITLFFWSKGALAPYLQAFISQNLSYVSSWSTPKVGAETWGLVFRTEVLGGVFFLLLLTKKFFDRTSFFLTIWFSFSVFAMLLSGRPYPHYIIQAIAPLALVLGYLIYGAHRYRFLPIPIIGIFLGSLLFYKFYYYPTNSYYKNFLQFTLGQKSWEEYINNFDSRMSKTYKIAKYIVEHTMLKDRIFIWGTEPELYALSRHVPPGRYITSFHIIDFNGQEETLKSLQENPPAYILIVKDEKRVLPGLNKFVASQYIHVDDIEGIEIWRKANRVLKAFFQ